MADKILAALDEQRKKFMQQIATIDIARAIYVSGLPCPAEITRPLLFYR